MSWYIIEEREILYGNCIAYYYSHACTAKTTMALLILVNLTYSAMLHSRHCRKLSVHLEKGLCSGEALEVVESVGDVSPAACTVSSSSYLIAQGHVVRDPHHRPLHHLAHRQRLGCSQPALNHGYIHGLLSSRRRESNSEDAGRPPPPRESRRRLPFRAIDYHKVLRRVAVLLICLLLWRRDFAVCRFSRR